VAMQQASLSRSLSGAKQAFASNNVTLSRLAHSGESKPFCAEQGHKTFAVSPLLRNHAKTILWSGTQAVVMTSVILTSMLGCEINIAGSQLTQMTLAVLLGVGAVLGYSQYLEKMAEKSVFDQEYKREKWECDNYLEGEQKEMVELYVSKGMTQADAETVIKLLSKNEKMFVDIMMVEELGLLPYNDLAPLWGGIVRFLSVLIVGCVPLIPFSGLLTDPKEVYSLNSPIYHSSLALSAATLILFGVLKETFHLDMASWWKQGVQTLFSLVVAVLSTLAATHLLRILFI